MIRLIYAKKKHKNGNYAVPNTQRGIWMWTRMWLSRMNFPVWGMAMMATMCAKERPRHGSHAVPKNKSNMQQLLQTSLWIGGSKVHVRTWTWNHDHFLGLKNRFICLEEENSAKARKTEVADATFRDIQLGRGVTIYIARAWQGCNGSSDCLFQVPRSWWARTSWPTLWLSPLSETWEFSILAAPVAANNGCPWNPEWSMQGRQWPGESRCCPWHNVQKPNDCVAVETHKSWDRL